MNPEQYESWEEAYDACRERNQPMIVSVCGEVAKIFPSGAYQAASQ